MPMTKQELRERLAYEKALYISGGRLRYLWGLLRCEMAPQLWRFVRSLRMAEYYAPRRKNDLFCMLRYQWYYSKKQRLQTKLGMEIGMGVFETGLQIFHPFGIVVNGDARVGKNCRLHGGNVIGNKGVSLEVPVLGDNVRLGAGAKVLGGVTVADGVQIGAGAVVLHSCATRGALLVGVPAKEHAKGERDHG